MLLFDLLFLVAEKSTLSLPDTSLKAVVTAFNEVVSLKLERFFSHKVRTESNPFPIITQPEKQIKELIVQFYNVIRY